MELRTVVILAVIAGTFAGPLRSGTEKCARECTERNNLRYVQDRTYKYKYNSVTSSYINGTTPDKSGLRVSCDVEIDVLNKCELSLNLKNVRLDQDSPSNEMLHREKVEHFRDTLEERPLMFSFQDGEIPELCSDVEEPTWSLNIKRAILSHFQASYLKEEKESAFETDVTGSCPTKYEAEHDYYGKLTIQKTKDFMGCSERHYIESSIQSDIYDPRAPTESLINSGQSCTQEIQDDLVKRVVCKERHISRPFANHTSGAITKVRTSLEFVDVSYRSGSSYKLERQVREKKTLVFEHKPKPHTDDIDQSQVRDVLTEICQKVDRDTRPEVAELFTKLVFRMRKLNFNGLRNVHNDIKDRKICPRNQKKIEKFFMDAIPMMSTTGAVSFMKEKIRSEEVKDIDADMWMTSLSFISHPTKEMIGEIKELVQYSKARRSTYLSLSTLIHKYCKTENRECIRESEVVEALRLFENNLGYKCSPSDEDEHNKIILSLKALANSGKISSATNTLTRCFQEEENPIEIRLAAVEAFRRMPCEKKGREELIKTFEKTEVDTEVRIATYLSIVKCPTPELFERIYNVLEKEDSNQVGSFVWSHLTNLNETDDPMKQELRKMVRDTKLMKHFNKDPRKFSRALEGTLFSEKLNVGGTIESHVVFSPKSYVPRSGMLNMTTDLFGYSINLFEFGGRVEGLDYLLEKFFGPNGYFPDNSLLDMVKPAKENRVVKRSAIKPSKLDNLNDRFNAKREDQPKGSMYLKMFGNEMSFIDFQDIDWMQPEKESINLLELLIKLSNEQTREFTKNMILMESSFVTPTICGFPLSIAVNSTASVNLKLSGKVDLRKIAVAPRSLNVTGMIRPSGVIEVSSEMSINAFVARTGLRMRTRMHSSTVLDGSISLDSGESFKVKFNVPDNRIDIIDVSNTLYLLNSEYPMELSGIRENYREHNKCSGQIVEKWAGVKLCGELRYPNASHKVEAPFFPLTGPFGAKVTLEKVDRTLMSYEMEAKYQVQKKRVNFKTEVSDIIRFMIGTPGTRIPRTHSVDVVLNRAQKAVNIDLVSLSKKLTFQSKIVNETDLKRVELKLNYNDEKEYTTNAEISIDRDSEQTRYMPSIEIRIPSRNDVTLTGSITHNKGRSLEADLTVDGFGKKTYIQSKVSNETNLKRVEMNINYNNEKQLFTNAEVSIEKYYDEIRYRPSVQIRLPKMKEITLTGTVTHQKGRSIDIDVTAEGMEKKITLKNKFVNEDDLKRVEFNVNYDKKEYITNAEVKIDKIDNRLILKPTVEIICPELKDIKLTGTIDHQKDLRLDIDANIEGMGKSVNLKNKLTYEKSLKKLELDLNYNNEKRYSTEAEISFEEQRDQLRMRPSVVVRLPESKEITLSGTITHQKQRSLDMDLTAVGFGKRITLQNTLLNRESSKKFELDFNYNNEKRVTGNAEVGIEKEENYLKLTPDFSVQITDFKKMTLSGTIAHQKLKSFVVDMSMEALDKTASLHHKILNEDALKRAEFTLNYNNEKEFVTNAEVAIDSTRYETRYQPTVEIRVPMMKYTTLRGTVTHQPEQMVDVDMSFERTDEPKITLVGRTSLSKEDDKKKITTDATFSHPKINLEMSHVFKYNSRYNSNDFELRYTPRSERTETLVWSSIFRDRTDEQVNHYEYTTSMSMSQYPNNNYEGEAIIKGAQRKLGSLDLTWCYGPRTCNDESKTITLNFEMKNESNVYVTKGDLNAELKHPAYDFDVKITQKHEHTKQYLESEFNVEYRQEKKLGMLLELRDESSSLKKKNGKFEVTIPSRKVSLRHEYEEVRPLNHVCLTTFEWEQNKRVTLRGEYNNNSNSNELKHDSRITLSYPGRDIILEGNVNKNSRHADAKTSFTYAPNRVITFETEYNNQGNNRKSQHEGIVKFNTPFRLFRDMQLTVNLENTTKLYQSEVTVQYSTEKSFTVESRYEDAGEERNARHEVEFNFRHPKRQLHLFSFVQRKDREYSFATEYKYTPLIGEKKEMTVALGYGNYTTDDSFHHEISMDITTPRRTITSEFTVEKTKQDLSSEMSFQWNNGKKLRMNLNLNNKSQRYHTEIEGTFRLEHPSRQMSVFVHHDNTTSRYNTRFDLTWEPTKTMRTEVVYEKTPVNADKNHHEITFTITHPQKTVVVSLNGEKGKRDLSSKLEIKLDGHSEFSVDVDYVNGTSERRLQHDATFHLNCDRHLTRPVDYKFHLEHAEKNFNLESKLSYSLDKKIEMEIVHTIPRLSEHHFRRELIVKLESPLRSEHPLKSITIDGNLERNNDEYSGDVELQWGRKERDQRVSLEGSCKHITSTDEKEFDITLKLKHPVELPLIPREPEITLNLFRSSEKKQGKVTYKWDDKKETSFETVYHNFTTTIKKHHLIDIIFKHPKLEEDLHLTTEAKFMDGADIFNIATSVVYSPKKEKEIYFLTKLQNKSSLKEMRFALITEARHLYNNVDIELNNEVSKSEDIYGASINLAYKQEDKYNNVKLNSQVNKKDKTFILETENPLKNLKMEGRFENRSTSEHSIYFMTLKNTIDKTKEMINTIDINTRDRLFEITLHHNPERTEDYARFTAQFLNKTAIEVRAHRKINGERITDGLIYTRLNTSELLHTRLYWRPSMPYEIKERVQRMAESVKRTVNEEIVQVLKEKYWDVYFKVNDEVRRITYENQDNIEEVKRLYSEINRKLKELYEENKPEYREEFEKMQKTVKDKYNDILYKMEQKYEDFRREYAEELKETLKKTWSDIKDNSEEYYYDEIRPVVGEVKEAWEDVSYLAKKDLEDIREYWQEQLDELKEYLDDVKRDLMERYYSDVKPMVEKMRRQYEETKMDMKIRYIEYKQKLGDKWDELREKIERKWEDVRRTLKEKYEGLDRTKFYQIKDKYNRMTIRIEELKQEAREIFEEYKRSAKVTYQLYKQKWNYYIEDARNSIERRWEESTIKSWVDESKEKYDEIYYSALRKIEEIKRMPEYEEIVSLLELKEVPYIVLEEAKWAVKYWNVEENIKRAMNETLTKGLGMLTDIKQYRQKYIKFEPENGNLFVTIPLPVEIRSFETLPEDLSDAVSSCYLSGLGDIDLYQFFYTFKPTLDVFNWIPPFKTHAMIVGKQHYMTFDKKFYEYAGACSYVLARDFIDGNFTVIVNYDRDSPKVVKKSITVITQGKEIEIFPDFSVNVADTPVELPIQHKNTTITREGSTVRVHNEHGVTVVCNLPRDFCTVTTSGWYYGKTAGLFGTYNNEKVDDFLTSYRSITDTAEDLARSWEVGRQCSSHRNRASKCENMSRNPKKELCENLFKNLTSPLRLCFGIVNPEPFMEMCMNDLCDSKNVADIESVPCTSAAAYIHECKMNNVPVYMPKNCVSCEKPLGDVFHKNEKIKLTEGEMNVPKSADVVFVVEEKSCNKDSAENLHELVRKIEAEFKSQGLQDNRFGLVGYGGDHVHSKEHSHTIDSKLFNKGRKFILGSDSLVFSENSKNNDTFLALRKAASYPFRTGVAKSIILLTCSDCRSSAISYDEISSILKKQGISLHILSDNGFSIKKASMTAMVYGYDVRAVFSSKDINNPYGSKEFRDFIHGDENQCTRLAQETNGTVFDSNMMKEKSFSDVFCPRMVFTSKPSPCQICECVVDEHDMGTSVCRPCEEPTPIRITNLGPSERGPAYQYVGPVKKLDGIIKQRL
ncbi:apolipophorins-like [Saccoglossus kowalevskii]|uniref:Apolipophorins-like n=1 Tax=Saccoglossus kowalevskii TaxID=10224 RepID=A0ABM0MLL1_SACKO|nr:PREDICTED: apolipophorins-like [Saccoglossus kowalevskii]